MRPTVRVRELVEIVGALVAAPELARAYAAAAGAAARAAGARGRAAV